MYRLKYVKVEALVDTMLLLLAPGAGDGLQGMKRGLTELADIVGKDQSHCQKKRKRFI